jgi:hypothetical protein
MRKTFDPDPPKYTDSNGTGSATLPMFLGVLIIKNNRTVERRESKRTK